MHVPQYGVNNIMETQTEFKDIEPSFNPINFSTLSPLWVSTLGNESAFNVENKELLRINKNGNVIAPDLESASEAGRIFVQTVRAQLNFKI
jgi:hypothetical protein